MISGNLEHVTVRENQASFNPIILVTNIAYLTVPMMGLNMSPVTLKLRFEWKMNPFATEIQFSYLSKNSVFI